jgi:2,4-dienoyl-CoA reductase-like NADH-dependent reductase (Old Yellow Enzyme family)
VHTMGKLWEPVSLGRTTLSNRLAMAPMTRDRATPSGRRTELNARYYAQRVSVGLIISEGTQPSEDGQGHLLTPGDSRGIARSTAYPTLSIHSAANGAVDVPTGAFATS